MKLKIKNGIIYDETDNVIGTISNDVSDEQIKEIEFGGEAIKAVKLFTETVRHGSFKPRQVFKIFEALVEKYS